MIRAARLRWIVLCVGIGVAGSYVSGWVGAVRAQRDEARPPGPPVGYRPPACGMPMMVLVPASSELVADAPGAWPRDGWHRPNRLNRGLTIWTVPAYESAESFANTPHGVRGLGIDRAEHGWPWIGVKSVRLYDSWLDCATPISSPEAADDPEVRLALRALEQLGLSKSRWRPYEYAPESGPFAYRCDEARLPLRRRGLVVPNPLDPPKTHLLPLDPVWPGFAFNALSFGGGAWALLAAPSLVGVAVGRRRRRRRRGLCVACGYDISGLDTCPECGGVA